MKICQTRKLTSKGDHIVWLTKTALKRSAPTYTQNYQIYRRYLHEQAKVIFNYLCAAKKKYSYSVCPINYSRIRKKLCLASEVATL
jgi:hypothetical protein